MALSGNTLCSLFTSFYPWVITCHIAELISSPLMFIISSDAVELPCSLGSDGVQPLGGTSRRLEVRHASYWVPPSEPQCPRASVPLLCVTALSGSSIQQCRSLTLSGVHFLLACSGYRSDRSYLAIAIASLWVFSRLSLVLCDLLMPLSESLY